MFPNISKKSLLDELKENKKDFIKYLNKKKEEEKNKENGDMNNFLIIRLMIIKKIIYQKNHIKIKILKIFLIKMEKKMKTYIIKKIINLIMQVL